MSTNRDKKLNRSDVRISIWKFILSFIILSAISFCAVFFFFKSYDIQRKGVEREVDGYKDLLSRGAALKIQIDSINYKMSLLDLNEVENDIYLRNQIAEDVRNAKRMMREDSADNLKHYAILLNKIRPMLALKTKIIEVNNQKQAAIRSVNQCMGKTDRINDELRVDPTRSFTGRRR
ncbi:type VI secretion system transmembrane protein TssO [Chryseobacterium chendengshani]|uniref:type VI secretion system TssO n=1 Tax=Chryseobacterium sp. LJ668 TaxID=2864040 RepID=UPI001C68C8DA|nr:type VI secretion system TssO [Chryseobacterium sp. LJ668]MBW8524069.1 type VI secretion system transmembrane protein TssO [Chryseobacterium sp. LJ668]QYK17005.1 type VI secretion system transmembrane protein TssO [Chryseobacterium sp. LJ668]